MSGTALKTTIRALLVGVMWSMLLLSRSLGESTLATPSPPLDGYAIFSQLRSAWAAMPYPHLVDFTVAVTTVSNGTMRTETYAGQAEPRLAEFRVRPFSVQEEQHPYVPHGINVGYSVNLSLSSGKQAPVVDGASAASVGHTGTLNKAQPSESFAIPEISPIYAFGMRDCRSRSIDDDEEPSHLRTIGAISSVTRRYQITVVGIEQIDGFKALHLHLVPLVDPRRDRLREVWVDPASDRVLQAELLGNFTGSAESSIPWLVTFLQIDGATYIDSEKSEAPLQRGRTIYDQVEIHFSNVKDDRGPPGVSFAIPADYHGLNAIFEPDESKKTSC